jgi:hypothetical protein
MLHRLTGKFRLGYLGTELEWNSPPFPHRLEAMKVGGIEIIGPSITGQLSDSAIR